MIFLKEFKGLVPPGSSSGSFIQIVHFKNKDEGEGQASTTQISSGEFGTAFSFFVDLYSGVPLPEKIIPLLSHSAIFNLMVNRLDDVYVSHAFHNNDPAEADRFLADRNNFYNSEGRFTDGRFRDKRIIYFIPYNTPGSFFKPFNPSDVTNIWGADIIGFNRPTDTGDQGIGEWIELIAHEISHCFRFVFNLRDFGATPLERINANIQDEVDTRIREKRIVSQIIARHRLPGYAGDDKATEPAIVQRDFASGKLIKTYLESFVLEELLEQAINKEALTNTQISDYNNSVDSLDLGVGWSMESGHFNNTIFWFARTISYSF